MKNFQEIADKCLNGELSGTFVCDLNGEIIKVSSNNLSRYKETCYLIDYPYPHTYDVYDKFGVTKMGHNRVINFISDIKENDKRTIQVSIQQAREWYNSGNNTLKTLALSSFSKEEIDPYPRSWEDCIYRFSIGFETTFDPSKFIINLMEKTSAYTKLLCLREEWIHIWSQGQGLKEDWEPNWDNNMEIKYVIMLKQKKCGGIVVDDRVERSSPLSFPTIGLATDFINTFKDLLNSSKGLY